MSHNLPLRSPRPEPDPWSRFSIDPRTAGFTRASDADRDVAAQLVNQAFAEGRLDAMEHAERLERALAIKQVGEFEPLLSDILPVVRTPRAPVRGARPALLANAAVRAWLGLAVLLNLIWVFTWIGRNLPYYYWPMWPMLGTAIPVVAAFLFGPAGTKGQPKQFGPPAGPAQLPGGDPPSREDWPRDPRAGGEQELR